MKKVIFSLIVSALIFVCVYFIGIQIAHVYVDRILSISLDWHLLFFDGGTVWFKVLTILAGLIVLEFLVSVYFNRKAMEKRRAKRKLTKEEKKRYARLEKEREAKKGLVELKFDNHLKTMLSDEARLRFPLFAKISPRKSWMIGGERTYRRAGLPIIGKKNKIYVDAGDTHTVILGTTGSGKDFSLLLPMLETMRMCGESVVINDPKGEAYDNLGWKFKQDGYDVHVLNFIDPDHSDGWNPLTLAFDAYEQALKEHEEEHRKWELKLEKTNDTDEIKRLLKYEPKIDKSYAMELLKDVCDALTYDKNSKDPFWNTSASNMAIGAGAFMMEEGRREWMNFTSIMNFIEQGNKNVDVQGKGNIPLLNLFMEKYRTISDDSSNMLKGFMQSESATRASLLSVFNNKFSVMTMNEKIRKMTSISTFDLKKIGERKMAIFLIVHDEKDTYYPLVTIFMKQLYERMIKLSRNENQRRLPVPVNIIFNEMGNSAPLTDLQNILTAARSRGVRMYMAFQDFEQANLVYNQSMTEIIKSNAMNLVYILSGSDKTQKTFSNMSGIQLVWNKERNCYEKEPVLTVDQLKSLKVGEMVFVRQRHKNPFLYRMPPYSDYAFYSSQKSPEFARSNFPEVEYFKMKDQQLNPVDLDVIEYSMDKDHFNRFRREGEKNEQVKTDDVVSDKMEI